PRPAATALTSAPRKGQAPHRTVRGLRKPRGSDSADVLSLRALLALPALELHTLTLIEGPGTRPGNCRAMHEDVRAASVLRDKAEALFAVEPLHAALSHVLYFILPVDEPSKCQARSRLQRCHALRYSSTSRARDCEVTIPQRIPLWSVDDCPGNGRVTAGRGHSAPAPMNFGRGCRPYLAGPATQARSPDEP